VGASLDGELGIGPCASDGADSPGARAIAVKVTTVPTTGDVADSL